MAADARWCGTSFAVKKAEEVVMVTQLFFYFLVICELAILGLLIWGIVAKIKNIVKTYYLTLDD